MEMKCPTRPVRAGEIRHIDVVILVRSDLLAIDDEVAGRWSCGLVWLGPPSESESAVQSSEKVPGASTSA
jgi:hypothetical protein